MAVKFRKPVRSAPNPYDRFTIVSIYPREIKESKPTIDPGFFHIPPGSYDNPSTLIVGTSCYWKEIDPEQPLLEIPVPAVQVADSIVKDFCNGIFGCDMNVSMPGLFYVPGELGISEIRHKYSHLLDKARVKQTSFFNTLVKLADVMWARTNGNPLSISDDARHAARELGVERVWMESFKTLTLDKCPACGSLRDSGFPVCPNCKTVIDPEKYKELGLQVAV